ncbi:unnamed protein product [Durusdinium trenchii]|uniref:Hexosyltransferase n=1 Tax=Durusdinium trenchii TaxID=1381693 RepID=A0ABP0NJF0_9DINO
MPSSTGEVENLLADGPVITHGNRSLAWRFHGAWITGLCAVAAVVYFGAVPSFTASERSQADRPTPSVRGVNLAHQVNLVVEDDIVKKAEEMEKQNTAGPSPLEKQYAQAQAARAAAKAAAANAAAAPAAQPKPAAPAAEVPAAPAAGAAAHPPATGAQPAHLSAAAPAQPAANVPAAQKPAAAVAEPEKAEACATATPGDTCYKAVLWAKWIGLIEHPDWYPGLHRATANRKAIQDWLHKHKQGSCKKPCDEASYPVPEVGKGKPSLFCISVARMGPEMDTMFMQRQIGAGIFACDGHAVYSDTSVDIDGFKTTLIPSTASGVSTDQTAANSQVFMNTWMSLLTSTKWYEFDFIAKVDPDCVFFPARLRGHVHNYVGQNVFFLNCGKYVPATMYGALEVYSKSSLGAYLASHKRCESSFPFNAWGEDKYMTNCLEMLGCKSVVDFGNFLHDERCWGVDCGNKQAVAFHAFKEVNHWYNCWLLSNHNGF